MTRSFAAQAVGSIFGIAGAALIAAALHPGLGFVAFLVSNVGWLAFSAWHGHWGLFAQQLVYLATSVLGVWTWLLRPVVMGA